MASGKIKFFNPAKGFGFIVPHGGGAEVFFHVSKIIGNPDDFAENVEVEFDQVQGKKGPEGTNVKMKN